MFKQKNLDLEIHLSRWIVEDGNYADFHIGEARRFAVEVWNQSPLTRSTEHVTALRKQRDHSYDFSGRLVFASDGVWVIDCGVLAYSDRKSEIDPECKAGDFVRGHLKFGVDPFFYFEQHCKIPHIPPMIYGWKINSIEQDTTPLNRTQLRTFCRMMVGCMFETRANAPSRRSAAQTRTLSPRTEVQNLFSTAQGSERKRVISCRVET